MSIKEQIVFCITRPIKSTQSYII